jgi:tetratricopeptide (TPR) repeat protein
VIITSRNQNWGNAAKLLLVEVFEPNEAVEFVLKRTNQMDEGSAELLAEETGFLPLALEQAGAYIEETGISLSDYLIRFKKHRKTALERGKPADYPDTVATTWEISFQAVKEKSPASVDLLKLCAFLAPDDIPKSLFLGEKDLPEPLASSTADEFAFDEIVAELRRYSLISGTGNKFSVHQMVQAVTRDRLTEDEQKNWSAVSVQLLNCAFQFGQDDVKSWEDCAPLLPHALASAGFAEDLGILSETVAEILNNAGCYQQHLADFDEARKSLERALKIDEKAFGLEHPSVAIRANNLGSVLQDLGEMEKARRCFERALRIFQKFFGDNHPSTRRAKANLDVMKIL